ncbi:MAG: hypothetical protein ACXABM_08615 [Candidatus Thorarchaeota archaeon]|jgi:uncharacterized BrkB/YihY/UPF0761 family membrane protein
MTYNREEFRDRDVSNGRYSEDYGCTWIGVIASLIVIVGLLIVILGSNASNVVITPGEFTPNTEFEPFIPTDSLTMTFTVPLAVIIVIIIWLYSRRNRSTLEAV